MASALNRVSQYVLHENRYSELGAPWSPSSPYTAISASLLQLEAHFALNESAADRIASQPANQEGTGAFVYAKALFHLSHCLLHHPFLLQQRLQRLGEKAPLSFSRAAWDVCHTHAQALTRLKRLRRSNVLMLPSLYGYCSMIAGTIHAIGMRDERPTVAQEAKEYFEQAIEFLQDVSRYWKHASLMVRSQTVVSSP